MSAEIAAHVAGHAARVEDVGPHGQHVEPDDAVGTLVGQRIGPFAKVGAALRAAQRRALRLSAVGDFAADVTDKLLRVGETVDLDADVRHQIVQIVGLDLLVAVLVDVVQQDVDGHVYDRHSGASRSQGMLAK